MSEHFNELQDRFSDAALELLMDQYAQNEGNRLMEAFRANDSVAAIPEELDLRCQKIIEKRHNRTVMASTLKRAGRAAACLLIALMLIFPMAMQAEAFRIPVLNFILKHGRGFTQITFSQNESSFSALDQLRVLIWAAIPDDYQFLVENVNTDKHNGTEAVSSILIRFENKEDSTLEVFISKAEGSTNIDSQDASVTTMDLYGQQTIFVAGDGELRAIWLNESQGQMYSVTGYDTVPDVFWECVHKLAEATQNPAENITF